MGANAQQKTSGLTVRSFVATLVALFVLGMWMEYVEKYNTYGGPFGENSPPNGAVGVIVGVLGLSALLYRFRRGLRLGSGELVVIYSALVLAAPLMTQGLWGRLFGLVAAIPKNEDFKSYESLPSMLWPHGRNLIGNNRFERGLEGWAQEGDGKLEWAAVDLGKKGKWHSPSLSNGVAGAKSALRWEQGRYGAGGREALVPGEQYLLSMRVKAEGLKKESLYFVSVQADAGPERMVLVQTGETRGSFANPEGFARVGVCPVTIPSELERRLAVRVGLAGEGRLTVQEVEFLNVEATEGLYTGRKVVREGALAKLGGDERDFTLVKPERLWSWAGLKYLARGYIPLRQWAMPAAAWTVLIGGLFAGFLGLNLLMRKQWAENERFSFPLTILPKNLFAEAPDGRGGVLLAVFRNRTMWIGFLCTFPLVVLKGLHFYNPSIPSPELGDIKFSEYVTAPLARAYLQDVGIGISWFSLFAIALLIETNVLFSLWAFYLLFQLWNLFGPAFNFNRFPGYPWRHQQTMGAFIAYAGLALFVGRRHLREVFAKVFGRGGGGAEERGEYRVALLLLASSVAALALWGVWTQMGLVASLLFFGYMLVLGFAASKIRAECGAPFAYLTPYFGMQFVAAVGGFAVFGAKGMLVATIASGFMTTSCFLLTAPVQVEMMELGRHFGVRTRDVGTGLALGLLGGLFIGGFTVLCWAYGFGANSLGTQWPYEQNWYYSGFRTGEANADRALEGGTLLTNPETQPLNFAHNVDAKGLGVGAVITVALAYLRSRFMWFPLQPLGYVLASSHFMQGFWFMALVAWLVRLVVFRVGGAPVIRKGLVPFCVGMFLACIASIIMFEGIGIYLKTQGIVEIYTKIP